MAVLTDQTGEALTDQLGNPLYDQLGAPDVDPPPTSGGGGGGSAPVSAVWTFSLAGCATRAYGGRELTTATGRTVTWRVDGGASAQFSIDGRSDEAAEIVDLATDLLVHRDGVLLFRGRIGPSSDTINADQHRCQFTAVDYRSMLQFRRAGAGGLLYVNDDQIDIALAIINYTQTPTGAGLGIVAGISTAPAQLRDKTIDPGKPLLEAINEISRLDNGFEWEISPELEFNAWTRRGSDNGVVLDYGGLITTVDRQLGTDFANQTIVTGALTTTPATTTMPFVELDERGLWQTSAGYPTIVDQATLVDRGAWLLNEVSTLRPTYVVTMTPTRWEGPDHLWIGDTALLAVKSGRLQVAADHRVVELNASIDENSLEKITLGMILE